jgi:hypothetical protein
MSPQASWSSPRSFALFFSQRMRMPRHIESHASVRSTTQRRGLCSCGRSGRVSWISAMCGW